MDERITTDFSGLTELVSDRWFDLDALDFRQAKRQLVLTLGNTRDGPFDSKILVFSDVHGVEVETRRGSGFIFFKTLDGTEPTSGSLPHSRWSWY